jgi:hypothetical protein
LRTIHPDQYWDSHEFPPGPLPVDHRVPITLIERIANLVPST